MGGKFESVSGPQVLRHWSHFSWFKRLKITIETVHACPRICARVDCDTFSWSFPTSDALPTISDLKLKMSSQLRHDPPYLASSRHIWGDFNYMSIMP